jgi:Flp pilus assembly pilin Flp
MTIIGKLLKDKRGIGAIEYALVASLISVAALAGYQSLGSKVETSFTSLDQTLSDKL